MALYHKYYEYYDEYRKEYMEKQALVHPARFRHAGTAPGSA